MGQEANSRRNASLDDKKRRAAGRRSHYPERDAIRDFNDTGIARKVAGAFGKGPADDFIPPPVEQPQAPPAA